MGNAMGFEALPWVAGTPMHAADADPEFIRKMGRYIAAATGPELSGSELDSGLTRLGEMLEWNVRELLGHDYAAAARRSAAVARKIRDGGAMRSYGDGRMAPCEWIRSTSSQVTKVDSFGHDCDHTIIGRQPWLWDAAGAAVEWGLDEHDEAALIENSALPANPTELRTFYRAAYAGFRAALCNLCSGACGDDAIERQRLAQAQAVYLTRLKSELDCFGR